MKPFIKIGRSYLNVVNIAAINEMVYYARGVIEDGKRIGNKQVRKIRVVSCGNVMHDFEDGTPEADALLKWLEGQTEVLL